MDPTNNPYKVMEVEERAFDMHSTLAVVIRFGFAGLFAGAIGGIYLESNARNGRDTAAVLLVPGVVFGLGIMASAILFVSGRRTLGCLLFPSISMLGFTTIGSMFDVAAGAWAPQTPRLTLWAVLSAYSLPGVLVLMLGCALVAKPGSWIRFAFSGGMIALISGAAPLVTNAAPVSTGLVPDSLLRCSWLR